jgi:hypothetical protein
MKDRRPLRSCDILALNDIRCYWATVRYEALVVARLTERRSIFSFHSLQPQTAQNTVLYRRVPETSAVLDGSLTEMVTLTEVRRFDWKPLQLRSSRWALRRHAKQECAAASLPQANRRNRKQPRGSSMRGV